MTKDIFESGELSNLLFRVTEEVFATMLGLSVDRNLEQPGRAATNNAERVVAFVGITGPYIGTGMLGCSPGLARKVASSMLMAEYSAVDEEV